MLIALLILIGFTVLSWAICVYIDYQDKNPFMFLWVLLILFVYMPLFVNYSLDIVNVGVVNSILLFAILSQFSYFFSSLFFQGVLNKGKITIKRKSISNEQGNLPIYVVYLGSAFVFFLFFINGIGVYEVFNATFLTKRDMGFSTLLILIISAIVLAQSYYVFKSKNIIHISYYVFFFSIIVLFYKSRSIIILGLLPLMYYLIFLTKNKKYLSLVLLIGPLILLATQFLRALRYQGALVNFDYSKLMSDFSFNMKMLFIEGDFAVIGTYFNIIRDCSLVTWCGNFTLLQSLAGVLTQFNGVKTLEYYLYDYYVSPGNQGSLHPTLFGFLYGDFGGYLGFTFFVFLGFLRSYISTFILDNKYFFIFNGFAMYFVLFMARGSVYNSLIFILMAIIMLLIVRLPFFKVMLKK